MQGIALNWYADFLRGRSQVVRVGRDESEMKTMRFGLSQGSVLGPKGSSNTPRMSPPCSSSTRSSSICTLMTCREGLKHGKPIDVPASVVAHEARVAEVSSLCASKRLQLNDDNIEMFWFGSAVNLHKMAPHSGDMRVGDSVLTPVSVVRDLVVLFDAELSMREHVSKTAQLCFTTCADYALCDIN